MESQPQNPEFRNNPESFHPCVHSKDSIETTLFVKWGTVENYIQDIRRGSKVVKLQTICTPAQYFCMKLQHSIRVCTLC